MLRSQAGVEEVDDVYGNLKQGFIRIRAAKDKRLDLARIVQVLEKEIGFEPVTEVTLEMRGRLAGHNGKLHFEVSETDQKFEVHRPPGNAARGTDNQLVEATAILAKPRSPDRIVLQQWKPVAAPTAEPRTQPSASTATAELVISGMT
ncbi:MAG: hypothetical protein ACREUU_17225 [Gammaproteobacteria bacterium]